MLKLKNFSMLLAAVFSLVACTSLGAGKTLPLKTVDFVEVDAYLGLWNELYRFPNEFQDDQPDGKSVCFNTTAEYDLIGDRKISVANSCSRMTPDNQVDTQVAQGTAWVANTKTNAELRVTFIPIPVIKWLGTGDYNILGLGPKGSDGKYAWAMVGSKDRNYAWILSRDKTIPQDLLDDLKNRFDQQGFDSTLFISTQK